MKASYRFYFGIVASAVLIFLAVDIDAVAGNNKECWNLVAVKAEWQKKNSDGRWVKVSPNKIKSHLSTDGSWQWVEFDDTSFSNGRVFVNAGWSPPPNQYCYPGDEIGITLKLANKHVNKNIRGNVAQLSWGSTGIYGSGTTTVSVGGFEAGASETGKVRMHNGQKSLQEAASWNASVQIGNMIGKVYYHYLPMTAKSQEKTKPASRSSQINTNSVSTASNSDVAYLNGNNDIFVRSLYYSILDRRPDESGARHWEQLLEQGKSRKWVITQIFNSTEYLNKHKSNTEYVRDLYQGILGRQPDSGGLSHWVDRLNSGSSRQSVLNDFLNSKEYRSRTSKR